MAIPLYLKVKRGEGTSPSFQVDKTNNCIQFNDNIYQFNQIFEDDGLSSIVQTNESNAYVFVGPTGAGKTTSAYNILKDLDFTGEITAFEMNDNKKFIDLLDDKTCKLKSNELVKQIFTRLLVSNIFNSRSTLETVANSTSSRSCLIITLHYQNHYITFIDLMGNEKFEMNQSNIFANVNMSSITSKLINGNGSSNSITNMIFNENHNTNIIVNLDQFGEAGLIKSTLNNVASLVKGFKQQSLVQKPKLTNTTLPSYARPTTSSVVRKSPNRTFGRQALKSPTKTSVRTHPNPIRQHNRISSLSALNLSATNPGRVPLRGISNSQKTSPNSSIDNSSQKSLPSARPATSRITSRIVPKVVPRKSMRELELELKGLRNENKDLLEENIEKGDQNEDLKMQVVQLNASLEQTQNQVAQLKESMAAMNEDMELQKDQINNFETERSSLNSQLQGSFIQINQQQTELTEAKQAISTNDDQVRALEAQLQEIIQSNNVQIDAFKAENEKLYQDVLDLNENKQTSTESITQLQTINSSLTEEVSTLKASIEEAAKSNNEVISELGDKNEQLKGLVIKLESQLLDINLELDGNTSKISGLQEEVEQLKESSESRSVENSELESMNEQLSQSLATLSEENGSYYDKINDLNEKVASLNHELTNAKDDVASSTLFSEEELKTVKDQNESLQTKLFETGDQVKQLESRIATLTEDLQHMSDESNSRQQQVDQLQLQLEKKSADALASSIRQEEVDLNNIDTINDLQISIREKDDEIRSLRSQYNKLILPDSPTFNTNDIFEDPIFEDPVEDKENSQLNSSKKSSPTKILAPRNENYKSMLNSLTKEKKLKRKSSNIKTNKPKLPKLKN